MLLAALRSERNTVSVGRASSMAFKAVSCIWGCRTSMGQRVGPFLATNPQSFTATPEAGSQPVPPRPHAPCIQAVLLAEFLRERDVREHVCHVVAVKGQIDLRTGLWVAHTEIKQASHPSPPLHLAD